MPYKQIRVEERRHRRDGAAALSGGRRARWRASRNGIGSMISRKDQAALCPSKALDAILRVGSRSWMPTVTDLVHPGIVTGDSPGWLKEIADIKIAGVLRLINTA